METKETCEYCCDTTCENVEVGRKITVHEREERGMTYSGFEYYSTNDIKHCMRVHRKYLKHALESERMIKKYSTGSEVATPLDQTEE